MGKSIFSELNSYTEMEEGLKIILSRLKEEESRTTEMDGPEWDMRIPRDRTRHNVAVILDSNGITDREAERFLLLMKKIILGERALDGSFEVDDILSSSKLTGKEKDDSLRILAKAKKGMVIPALRTARMQREERDWVFDLAAAYRSDTLNERELKDLVRIIRKSGVRPDRSGKVCVVDVLFSDNLSDADTDMFSLYQSAVEGKFKTQKK